MPVVVEGNFRQQPAAAASLQASPSTPSRTMSPDGSEASAFALIEAAGSQANLPAVGDSTFINGSGTTNGAGLLHPWNGTIPDISRSPSVGDTFVSAAASSDMPYPSSFSDCTDDSESGPDEEVADVADRASFPYITTATITLLSGSNNSIDPVDVTGSGGHLPPPNRLESNGPVVPVETTPETHLKQGALSPGQGPSSSSSSSATTSISVTIASVGEDSTERELNESHVSVQIVPEKKGLFLKHSEYEIKLKGMEKTVRRRYKDFVTLHRYLAEKYPYRLLPALPPKQLMLDSLLEERRRGLQTWLIIVSLHPVLGNSPIVCTFLRDTTTDHQYRLRVAYEKQMDELVRLRPDATLPDANVDALVEARTRLRRVQHSMGRLQQLYDRRLCHSQRQPAECAEIDRILQCRDLRDVFREDGTFEDMCTGERFVAKQYERYVQVQQRAVTERLDVLLQVLHAHSELCERIEKSIMADQHRALAKSAAGSTGSNRTKTKAPSNSQSATPAQYDAPDSNHLARRSAFAYSCAQAETALAERYLQSLPSILLSYAHEEQQHHQKMSKIWHRLVVSESSRLD
ncbi:sorting nexin-8-like isoform X2 [Anopheles moucheti]|uniref:sorting nexin-8-like isoform X2 n=1 Tax=Anopheles moucheti TaxID=186751 RepID=UPI0022F136C8|nr:sorting nexin-8-like isoform X2 [Anopheles moucheti]